MKKEVSPNARIPFYVRTMAKTTFVMALVFFLWWLSPVVPSLRVYADDSGTSVRTPSDIRTDRPLETKTLIDQQVASGRFSGATKEGTFANALVSEIGALALVLCVFFGFVYLGKLLLPKRSRKLSSSVEVVDSCFLDSKNELITVRWGRRLILVVRNQGNWTTLSEISCPEEVEFFLREKASVDDEKSDRVVFFKTLKSKSRVDDENQKH